MWAARGVGTQSRDSTRRLAEGTVIREEEDGFKFLLDHKQDRARAIGTLESILSRLKK